MNIRPTGTIKLLTVPILTNVESTKIMFMTQAAQSNYYNTLNAYTLSSYDVLSDDVIRVSLPADMLGQYNYLMFSSSYYAGKTFYCRISEIVGINSGTSDIYIYLDIPQTFGYDGSKLRYISSIPIGNYNNIAPETLTIKAGNTAQFNVSFNSYTHYSRLADFSISPVTAGVSVTSSGKLTIASSVSTTDVTLTATDRFSNATVSATIHIV